MPGNVFFIQRNFSVGDIDGNARLLIDGARAAAAAGACAALSPELSLCGYPAEDMLREPSFLAKTRAALARVASESPPSVALLVGLPHMENGALFNVCALVRGGAVAGMRKKSALPNYSVFDEKRHFSAAVGEPPLTFEAGGEIHAALICEEIWTTELAAAAKAAGATSALAINGSPFFAGKQELRQRTAAAFARAFGGRVFYANGVGGQDELVFDGASFVVDGAGELIGRLPAFAEAVGAATTVAPYPDDDAAAYAALELGLGDYGRKCGFSDGVVLGLSGGVDSALTAALAVDAFGGDRVLTAMIPSRHTSAASIADAAALAGNLGTRYLTMPLDELFDRAAATAAPHMRRREGDVTAENLQARLRGTLLMALANNHQRLLLATGNKSEFACGYATLYGDMNGGFAPIKDALKTQVWRLCRFRNRRAGEALIPERVISRAPSAELRPNQTDQDDLPPYERIDAMLTDHLAGAAPAEMAAKHGDAAVADFYRRLTASEHKRRQAPPGTKISERAFGRDWRMPIASRFSYV